MLRKLLLAAASKGLGSTISVVFTVLIARLLGAEGAGPVLFGLTVLTVGATTLRLGFDSLLVKQVGASGIDGAANIWVSRAILLTSLASTAPAVAGFIWAEEIAVRLFNAPEFTPVLGWIALSLPPLAIANLLGFAFQGLRLPMLSVIGQNLGYLSLALFGVCLWHFWLGLPLGAGQIARFLFCATVVTMLGLGLLWLHQPGARFIWRLRMTITEVRAAANLWLAMLMTLTVTWSGILIGGRFVSSEQIAFTAAAQRIAILVVFILLVVDLLVAPEFARSYARGDRDHLRRIAKRSTRGMALMGLPVVAALMLFSEQIMGVHGPEFSQAAPVLVIYALGQMINVCTGSVGQLLMMCDGERDYRLGQSVAAVLTVAATLLLAPAYGAVGIAVASALGIATQNVFSVVMVRRRLGFIPGF